MRIRELKSQKKRNRGGNDTRNCRTKSKISKHQRGKKKQEPGTMDAGTNLSNNHHFCLCRFSGSKNHFIHRTSFDPEPQSIHYRPNRAKPVVAVVTIACNPTNNPPRPPAYHIRHYPHPSLARLPLHAMNQSSIELFTLTTRVAACTG